MNKNLTDIVLVVDRSGSMISCKDDAQGGIKTFIEEQKKVEGDANFTLVQFDNEYDFIHKGIPIADVPEYTLCPRGSTALLDAVGRAINETGERLSKISENNRPGCVVFVIVTDGCENASKEFTRDQIRKMITCQKDEYNWQFTFIGADDSTFAEAGSLGISKNMVLQYNANEKSKEAFNIASNKVRQVRCSTMCGQSVDMSYTNEERKEAT